MSKIHVISERGQLVGTFVPPPKPADPRVPACAPVLRRGQRLHELEIENAESYYREGDFVGLHKLVMKKLKLK